MMMALSYSLKRIWRTRSKLILMGFFLSLGFWGWLISESAQSSIKKNLAANAKQILSADITLSVRREFTEKEVQTIQNLTFGKGELIKGYEFFAMMSAANDTRLVLVRVLEDSYPFYGKLTTNPAGLTSDLKNHNLWAYEEFKSLFDLQLNETVTLGESKFKVSSFVTEDRTQTFRLASLAPRVFIHMSDLKSTNLIQFGSTFTTTYFFKTKSGVDVEALTKSLKKDIVDPAVDITSFLSLPDDESSPTQRLADFLGLTSLVALLFSALSLFYLLQIWSLEQQKERALLTSFGFDRIALYVVETVQSLAVSFMSTLFSWILMLMTKPIIEHSLHEWMDQNFTLSIGTREIFLILVSQFILLTVLSNPFSKSSQSPLAQLIKSNFSVQQTGFGKLFPLFILIWPYAVLASNSFQNGSYFFFGLLFIAVSLVLIGRGLIHLLSRFSMSSWRYTLAIKSLKRQSTSTWAFIFTVGTASALLNLIPQIQSSIQGMMRLDQIQERPSLFVFDIQNEQWPEFQEFLKSFEVKPTAASPLIRARILKINDLSFERKESNSLFKTREEETEIRFRNRGVNITYRPHLQVGEEIVKGPEFPLIYSSNQKYAFVSLEKRYSDRIGAKMGDVITFDIQGVEIQAEVKNLRQVMWSRFEPNFFILFQDGLLNDAPQTHLASLPYMEGDKRLTLMKKLSAKFPNVSMIDVERLMRDVIRNLEKISGALKLMTYLTLLTGLMTLVFLLRSESARRSFEVHLLKIMGTSSRDILKVRLLEVFILDTISILVGVGTSYIIAYVIVDQVFQIPFILSYWPALVISASVFILSWGVSVFSIRRVYNENSFTFLKKEE